MKRKTQKWLAVVVLLTTSSVAAQVVRTQTGQALDASYRLGSGGYNPAGPARGFHSQLYVTGQVTGLGGFRGRTGYRPADQLALDLPSGVLDTFRGQSVGVAQALDGGAYQYRAYYGRAVTAFGARSILGGRTVAGTGIPLPAGSTSQATRQLYVDATKNYSGLMALRSQGLRISGPQHQPAAGRRFPGADRAVGSPALPPGPPWQQPSAIGLLRDSDRLALANKLYKLAWIDARRDDAVKAEVDASTDKSADEKAANAETPALRPIPGGAREQRQGAGPAGIEGDGEADFQPPSAGGLPAPNQDVFLDLLRRLRDGAEEQERPGELPGKDDKAKRPASARKRIVETTAPNQIVIYGLAGRGKDQFNAHMARARGLLRDGKYYAAGREYNYATILNPGNPLTQIGQSLAYVGAGEMLTAAFHLRRAFQIFPPIMKTRVVVREIVGSRMFERRLKAIDRHLSEKQLRGKKQMLLLATFLHHAADHKAEAQKAAEALKKAAGDDKLLAAYAEYVCTGKLPGRKRTGPPSGR